jgi:hypothetical protein
MSAPRLKPNVINERSGLLINKDQRVIGGLREYAPSNNAATTTTTTKQGRFTKIGNFVIHKRDTRAQNDEDNEYRISNDRRGYDMNMNSSFSFYGQVFLKAVGVLIITLSALMAVAAAGKAAVLYGSKNMNGRSSSQQQQQQQQQQQIQAFTKTNNNNNNDNPTMSFTSKMTPSSSSSYDAAMIGLREEPFIDANEKSIASEGVSLDGWFHVSASIFKPSTSNGEDSNNNKAAYVFPPALSKPDKNFAWTSEGDLGAKLVSQKGESVARAAFTAHRRTFITDSDLTAIKRSGLTHVRVPITWAMFAEDEEFERGEELIIVDPMYKDRMFIQASGEDLTDMVKKVKKNDLKVVLALKGMPGGASNDEGDGAWPHEASFFREFSKLTNFDNQDSNEREQQQQTESSSVGGTKKEVKSSSNSNSNNRKLLFGGASGASSSTSNDNNSAANNKKIERAKKVAEMGETATGNFLKWLAGLDEGLKSTIVGISLIDAPTAKDPKQRAAALIWLEKTSQMFREIIVEPIVSMRMESGNKNNKHETSLPFLHITMSQTMGIDIDEMAKWMRKTFTTDERSTWAALDVQHAFPRGVGACVGGSSRGCAFDCNDSVDQVARSIGDASDSFAKELRSAASEHGVPHVAVSEWSLNADEEGQCPNAGQFLDAAFAQQVRAHRASNVRGYFWRWKSAYDNIENENDSLSTQMSRKKYLGSNSLREYLSNRGDKTGLVGDVNGGKGKVSTAGWMDEGGISRNDKFDRFKPKDKSIPYAKTPEEFDDELQMTSVADDWSIRMTSAIANAKGGNSNIMDLLREEDEGLGMREEDIEKALLNPNAESSLKTFKGFESESDKRKKLIDSLKAFGESASRFDDLSKGKTRKVIEENDEIYNENGDALKRAMDPFEKPAKLIEREFSDRYGNDELINPDFRARKDLGLNELIDGDNGLQKLDEELQEAVVDGLAEDAVYQTRDTAAKLLNSDSDTFSEDDDEFNRLLTDAETPIMSMPKSQEERENELIAKKWASYPERDGQKAALRVLENGFDPLSMRNDKKLDQVIGDDASDEDIEAATKRIELRAAAKAKTDDLSKTIEKNLANMSKEDLLKLAEQAKTGKLNNALSFAN